MEFAAIFDKNFFSFAEMLGGAPGGALLPLSGRSFAASSGQRSAGENYALLAEGAEGRDVENALGFFAARGAGFVVPWLRQTPQSVARALLERKLERRRIYTSMYLAPGNTAGAAGDGLAAIDAEKAARWGETVWRAFGGEEGEEERAYLPFCGYLAAHPKNRAFALDEAGRFVTTALVHETPEACGLYYFATMPDRRRQGLAAALLDRVRALLPARKPLVLLATEAGLPFYINYGFKIIDKVPIYSATDDI